MEEGVKVLEALRGHLRPWI